MLGLMIYVICDNDETDIAMMTAFRKQIAHTSAGIRVVPHVIQYEQTRLTPLFFIIDWHALEITDVHI